ncbi:(2Fe-2S)-binding protein [Siphonobacter aquaeclarae]|uniref:Isoquinoline 1-oxidoreductase, alpha subunit n=1 Tax=Siphonobacter aquaeclarae TaxID=563176 RepID=A0A1G9RBK4_9BACT|nr:(2Fe-2S)-binding protein [Siphonobacter aquaeclarae]SDM20689.1 isoquinoline 1-oxidoreductase, alpha subunit [Siphonobacter aquaeclarae]
MAKYSIQVNNKTHEVDALEDMPLLWVLRDILGLRGTKFGCGRALCGACTVHLNGTAVRSCSLPVSAVGDGKITTIEGLAENGDHPLQQAWEKLVVPQCGYCQTGQIMNAAALLQSNPHPSEDEIEGAMQGNLCRCGTYNRIKAAILSVATA